MKHIITQFALLIALGLSCTSDRANLCSAGVPTASG